MAVDQKRGGAGKIKWTIRVFFIAALIWIGWQVTSAIAPNRHGIDPQHFEDAALRPQPDIRVTPQQSYPNIVVILADDLGYGDVGAYGNTTFATPNIDALARQGVRMTNFYASAGVCSPSRAGLLTGRYPVRTGVVNALQAGKDTAMRTFMFDLGVALAGLGSTDLAGGRSLSKGLPLHEITLAEALQEAGYKTSAVGKWHLGDFTVLPQFHPFRHGFDHFVGFNMSNDDFPVGFFEGEDQLVIDIGSQQSHYTRVFTEAAVEFIRSSKDNPFFLYMAHKDPHLPFFPSQQFKGKTNGGPYGDVVSELDWSVGEIMRTLDELGLAENTLLIFTSDNGPWFEGSAGGFRGRKGQSFEGGFRVPFIARWPGEIETDSISDVPAMNIDIFPTALSLAGVSPPEDRIIDGTDLMPLITGTTNGLNRPLFFFHDFDLEAMRLGDWKFLERNSTYAWPSPLDKPTTFAGRAARARHYTPAGEDEAIPTTNTWPKLYHLSDDESESYDVITKWPERANRLRGQLLEAREEFLSNPIGWKD